MDTVVGICSCVCKRQGYEPRIYGTCYFLRDFCLNEQIQAQRKTIYCGNTVCVSLWHVGRSDLCAAVLVAVLCLIIIQILFQVVLCADLICFQDSRQGICQLGASVMVYASVAASVGQCGLGHICCISRVKLQDFSQSFRNLIDQLDVCTVSFCIAVGFDLTDFQVSELYTLDSIIFQGILYSGIRLTGSFDLAFCVVISCFSRSDIVFVDGKRPRLTAIKDIGLVKVICCSRIILWICGIRRSLRCGRFSSEYCHWRQGHSRQRS